MMASKLLCPLVLLLTGLLALVTCPHSKVEESFNLQATHDLFYHGVGPAWRSAITKWRCREADDICNDGTMILPYDHLQFPGVVPRTFTGAFVLSYIARIISFIVPKSILDLPSHPMVVQFLIRFTLLIFSWLAHIRLATSLEVYVSMQQNNKNPTSKNRMIFGYYLLITASQFHIPFYSSRLLPNTFALLLTTHAYAEWFNNRPRRTAIYLVLTTAIFRCDVLLLLVTIGLTMLIRRELRIVEALCIGIVTGITALVMTVPMDSLLWQRMVWPEFEVWWFNSVDNRSSEWGVMPFYWYFANALPKGMLLTLFLVPLAFLNLPAFFQKEAQNRKHNAKNYIMQTNAIIDQRMLPFFASTVGFVFLYSFLPHKEMRFIFAALPIFNACAAYGLSKLHAMAMHRGKGGGMNIVRKCLYALGLLAVVITMIGSFLFLRLSIENYPGGVALERLKNHFGSTKIAPRWEEVHVHIDVAAAMTGVSLFGQRSVTHLYPIQISKSGYEAENSADASSRAYTHLLSEEQSVKGFHVVDTIDGFPSLNKRNLRVDTQPAIYILERDGWLPKYTRVIGGTITWYHFIAALSFGFIITTCIWCWKYYTVKTTQKKIL